jgi:N-acetylneuraminic acid mutarotase
MVYDPISQHIFMLGGIRRIEDRAGLSEVWAYDPGSNLWQQKGDLPTKIVVCAAYDEESARIIVLARGTYKDSTTWAYDPTTDQWQEMNPEIIPRQRYGSSCSYDAESDRVIMFGGTPDSRPYLPYDDTWAYDYNSNPWTEMQPPVAPPPRTFQGMAYDYESDRVFMWGGVLDFSAHTEDLRMWAYDTNTDTWESYPNRSDNMASWYLFGMVYHPPTDQLIMFTGADPTFELYPHEALIDAATWAYDYNTNVWTLLTPISSPGRRAGYMMACAPSVDKVFLFGGVIPSDIEETSHELWAYDPTTNEWANLTPDTVTP